MKYDAKFRAKWNHIRSQVGDMFPGSSLDRDRGSVIWESILKRTDSSLVAALIHSGEHSGSPRVLFTSSIGRDWLTMSVDSLVAVAVQLRAASPHLLLCDGALPACTVCVYKRIMDVNRFVTGGPSYCRVCYARGRSYYVPLNVPVNTYSQYCGRAEAADVLREVQTLSLNDCFSYNYSGADIGESVEAGVMRFYGNATLRDEDPDLLLRVSRRYLAGAIVAARVTERILDAICPDIVVAPLGIYVPLGVITTIARRHGVHIANWAATYREGTVVFSHGDTYHRTLLTEPSAYWENMPWTPAHERLIDEYLRSRREGNGDWPWMPAVGGRVEDQTRIQRALQLDPGKPTFCLLSNIAWDAKILYPSQTFDDMFDWIFTTLDYFAQHPELQLIVRVHPHEVRVVNRQFVLERIRRERPALPQNIKLVAHDSEFSTYALVDISRAALVYGTTTAIEIAATGTPVVVAADAWIRNKGISYDINSREEYTALLERLTQLGPMSAETLERAKRYAYHFFFRRMIKVNALGWDERGELRPKLNVDSLADLLPGHDPGLDVICDGILHGKEFIYDPTIGQSIG